MNKINAKNIAEFLILKNSVFSPYKIQKIIYFAYREYLIKNKGTKKLFNDKFEAWINGPVIRNVYDFYRKIIEEYSEIENFIFKNKNKLKKYNDHRYQFVQDIFMKLKYVSVDYLIFISHDSAWSKARKKLLPNEIGKNFIKNNDIFNTKGEYDIYEINKIKK